MSEIDNLRKQVAILREGLITAIWWLDLETPDTMRTIIANHYR